MKEHLENIYRIARRTAGLTQERWAECLGISPEAVRQYEAGIIMPSDETVIRMVEVSGLHILGYRHLVRKSRLAAKILPELEEQKGLPEAVLGLLIQLDDFREDGMKKLVRIAADGKIDEDETEEYLRILEQLRELLRRGYELSYAE